MSNFKLCFWVVLFGALCSFANDNNDDVNQWMQLMQYQKQGAGFKSKVISSGFFISPKGASNPQTELEATIAIFQKLQPAGNQHPQCVFPARYAVLKKSFSLAAPVFCEDFNDWKTKYQMSYASLFYAGPYMSSPASVFGHSFLLLGSTKNEEYSQLTFNYAADIPSDVGAFDYAYKGITGGFPGTISILPYYERLYQYTDMENRDLWEYRLNLTPTEVELLANYVWEIKTQVSFEYFFLDENCASILLWILKAVKPKIDVTTSNGIYVLPSEVSQVAARENLVQKVVYHPALLKRLKSKLNQMTPVEKTGFQSILASEALPSTESSQLLLEALQDHINIERHRRRGELSANLKPLEREVLLKRSQIQKTPLAFNEAETPLMPHTAHLPLRLQFGPVFRNGAASTSFKLRPGVHDVLDYAAGYLPNSSVKILEFEIHAVENKKLRLQNLTLLSLANYSNIDFYQAPFSWSADVQIRQNDFNIINEQLFGEVELAAGYSVGSESLLFYTLLSTAARTFGARPLGDFELGPQAGLLYSLGNFKTHVSAAYLWQTSAQREPVFVKLFAELSYRLSPEWGLHSGYVLVQDLNENFKFEQTNFALEYFF